MISIRAWNLSHPLEEERIVIEWKYKRRGIRARLRMLYCNIFYDYISYRED